MIQRTYRHAIKHFKTLQHNAGIEIITDVCALACIVMIFSSTEHVVFGLAVTFLVGVSSFFHLVDTHFHGFKWSVRDDIAYFAVCLVGALVLDCPLWVTIAGLSFALALGASHLRRVSQARWILQVRTFLALAPLSMSLSRDSLGM
ncbi:MAG: hypothetical protein LKI93_04585 [Bifidobacteriaceae bacterium]|nr:hypothetical protein [Bifidobacteriaceae bacterium]